MSKSFMMNDPREYKNPERFMPERFLGENPERDPRELAFGFGRRYDQVSLYMQIRFGNGCFRQCPGRLLAEDVIFIACTMSLAVFDIQKKVRNGVVIEPVRQMSRGFSR
jgi:cytochrome P450